MKAIIVKAISHGDIVDLYYSDGEVVTVKSEDYNRAFGPIISAEKKEVIRDYSLTKLRNANRSGE